MELPKILLATLIAGVTLSAASCTKDIKHNLQTCNDAQCENPQHGTDGNYDCPACGMG